MRESVLHLPYNPLKNLERWKSQFYPTHPDFYTPGRQFRKMFSDVLNDIPYREEAILVLPAVPLVFGPIALGEFLVEWFRDQKEIRSDLGEIRRKGYSITRDDINADRETYRFPRRDAMWYDLGSALDLLATQPERITPYRTFKAEQSSRHEHWIVRDKANLVLSLSQDVGVNL